MQDISLIVYSVFFGILFSRTDFLERVKHFLQGTNCKLLAKGLDCPFCCSFWSGIIFGLIFDFDNTLLIACSSSVLGYFIAKGD
jgi:hypothetical protein